ncbi:MAG: hypothetical protein PUP92_14205 [Rhizonema sp. PD38]|nr:hypothetical protein [Rhizonema sp. PD38]
MFQLIHLNANSESQWLQITKEGSRKHLGQSAALTLAGSRTDRFPISNEGLSSVTFTGYAICRRQQRSYRT